MTGAGKPSVVLAVRRTSDPPGAGPLVTAGLRSRGVRVEELVVPDEGLPRGRHLRRMAESFSATPAPLIESWRVARHVEAMTRPGDTVLFGDRGGHGGVFVLEQRCRPIAERRSTLVWAADSLTLEYLAVTGTLGGLPAEDAHAIDWELVAYRYADGVLATGRTALGVLASLGVEAGLVTAPDLPVEQSTTARNRVLVPEPVSRLARTPDILRALAGRAATPGLTATVSPTDREDRLWKGTTWDAVGVSRRLLGKGLQRGSDPAAGTVILGDPFHAPPPEAEEARRRGARMLVGEGSAASAVWPDAETWRDEDQLDRLLGGENGEQGDRPTGEIAWPQPVETVDRATRISVGIPIFEDVSHLDECIESLLQQRRPPDEILLIDDGSASKEVDAALDRWHDRRPDLIRVLRQKNRGVSVARNLALETMTGDAFLFVDSDDVLDPDFISSCALTLQTDESLWAVATWTEFFGAYAGVEAKPPFDARVGLRENPIISTCVLVDMRTRDAGIRFPPDLSFIFCEDWDVWAQIVAAGGRIGLVPRPLARHRVHESSGGFRRTDLAYDIGRARASARLRNLWPYG